MQKNGLVNFFDCCNFWADGGYGNGYVMVDIMGIVMVTNDDMYLQGCGMIGNGEWVFVREICQNNVAIYELFMFVGLL